MRIHTRLIIVCSMAICMYGRQVPVFAESIVSDDFEYVFYNISNTTGKFVIWGASITELTHSDQGSEVVFLQIPLEKLGDDASSKYTLGRFIAKSVDTTMMNQYKNGDLVVVTGYVAGSETRSLGSGSYNYPVLRARSILRCVREADYKTFRRDSTVIMVPLKDVNELKQRASIFHNIIAEDSK